MRHFSRFAVGSILLLPVCLSARVKATEDLFPGQLGSTWTYSGMFSGQKMTMGSTIVSATGGLQRTLVMRWTANGRPSQEETYIVRPGEVVRSKSGAAGTGAITPPLPIIKYPMTVGKTWQWRGTVASGGNQLNGTANLKVAAHEKVQTGTGAVMAYRVDLDLTIAAGGQSLKLANSYWFAPGLGMVRQRAQLPNGSAVDASLATIKLK